jgi:hypothetical protein
MLSIKDKIWAYWSASFLIAWSYGYLILSSEDQLLMNRSFYNFLALSVDVLINAVMFLVFPSAISWGFSNPRTLINRSRNTLKATIVLVIILLYGHFR